MTTRVQCAHCGKIYRGESEALTWLNASACAGGHQIKTYEYAPDLKPPLDVEAGPRQPEGKS